MKCTKITSAIFTFTFIFLFSSSSYCQTEIDCASICLQSMQQSECNCGVFVPDLAAKIRGSDTATFEIGQLIKLVNLASEKQMQLVNNLDQLENKLLSGDQKSDYSALKKQIIEINANLKNTETILNWSAYHLSEELLKKYSTTDK